MKRGEGKRHATSKGLGWYGKCITTDDRIIDLLTTGSSNKRSTTRLLFHSYSRLFFMIYKTSPSIKIITYTPTFFFFNCVSVMNEIGFLRFYAHLIAVSSRRLLLNKVSMWAPGVNAPGGKWVWHPCPKRWYWIDLKRLRFSLIIHRCHTNKSDLFQWWSHVPRDTLMQSFCWRWKRE